ncbi:MAG: nitroreductase family protein [Coprothermobacterota bacterium]|nr:nitroreductase family protein [Coprothermobacterota bacterium]
MDVWTAVKTRRSIRSFTPGEVSEADLKNLILEAGIWAPSGGNAQTWRFVILTDLNVLNKIKLVSPGLLGNPSALIVICQDLSLAFEKGGELGVSTLSLMDTAMAAQNIMLVAHASGLGSCPVASFHPEAIQKILNLPAHIRPQLLITIGIPKDTPTAPRRKTDVIWVNRYGNK